MNNKTLFFHSERIINPHGSLEVKQPITLCGIVNGKHIYIGKATKYHKDTPNRKLARIVSLGRAIKRPTFIMPAGESFKETRKKFLDYCHLNFPKPEKTFTHEEN